MIKSIFAGATVLAVLGSSVALATEDASAGKPAGLAAVPKVSSNAADAPKAVAPASAATTLGAMVPTAATPASPEATAATATSAVEPASQTAALVPAPAAKPTPPPPPPVTLRVSIDLSGQRMVVSENGKAIHTWPISSGRAGYRTPTGTYKPKWLSRMHYSRKYDNAPMPYSVFFHGGFAIHGTYATGMLGRPASHGCIRLAPGNAKKLFNLVSRHGRQQTVIALSGTAPAGGKAVARNSKRKRGSTYSSYESSGSSFWFGTPQPKRSAAKPKIIYRNGQAYVYVGPSAARRARQRYSGNPYGGY